MGNAMDTQFLDDTPVAPQLHDRELTFHWLYQRVQKLVDHSIYPKPGAVERWSLRIGAGAAVVGLATGLLFDTWLPVGVQLPLMFVCLLVEVGGFAISAILGASREFRQYIQPRLSHAREMDGEYTHWQAVIAELRQFPAREREQRLRYVTVLRAGMIDRMGLVYGGLQRLGPFPLLVAMYVQYRSWRADGWTGVFDVGWAGGILIFTMLMLYVLGWVLISQRTRLDTYVNPLEGSLQETGHDTIGHRRIGNTP